MLKQITALFAVFAIMLGLSSCVAFQPEPFSEAASQAPTWQEQYDLGVRYLSEGNYEEAILAFTVAIEIDPKQALAYVGRGDAYVLSGETEENLAAAKADYEGAIELDETIAKAYLGLADVYARQGDYEKALEVLEQGLEKTGNAQSIQNKISEMESAHASDIIDENPIVTLVREGDSGGLPHANEVTFWGNDPSIVSFSDAERILGEHGFYCEYSSDGVLLGNKEKTADGFFGPLAIVHPDDDSNFIRSYSFSELLSVGTYEQKYGPINIGLRDICTIDSPETVFTKLGFTNAPELADYLISLHSLSLDEQIQSTRDIQYYNGYFGLDSPSGISTDSWDFNFHMQGSAGSPSYSVTFTFLKIADTNTYQLDGIYCFIYNRT